MVWTRSPVYFYQRNDIYYFSRAVPKDLQARFNKRRVEVSLKTKSVDKARSLSMTLSDRLERYWDSLRLEQIHSRELELSLINADLRPDDKRASLSLDDALRCYQSLKGAGKGDFEGLKSDPKISTEGLRLLHDFWPEEFSFTEQGRFVQSDDVPF